MRLYNANVHTHTRARARRHTHAHTHARAQLSKVVGDNIAYAKAVKLMGTRDLAAGCDFSGGA